VASADPFQRFYAKTRLYDRSLGGGGRPDPVVLQCITKDVYSNGFVVMMTRRSYSYLQTPAVCWGLGAVILFLAAACRPEPLQPPTTGELHAFVTILPQAYFVERIGGKHVAVEVMVGPGQSYHSYEPAPRQMADLAGARVYFTIGVPFERTLVEKIHSTNPHLVVVDTREGIKLRPSTDHCEDELHDHPGEGNKDPHIWLDPKLVKTQAQTIATALARLDPAHALDYDANCRAFQADLDAADARAAKTLAPYKGREFFVFHPSFGYFGDAYGLKQLAVEESGKEPGGRDLAEMIERAKKAGVHTIFVQPQFATSSARTVASEIGGDLVSLDPLAKDYLANLDVMAGKIAASFDPTRTNATEKLTTVRR